MQEESVQFKNMNTCKSCKQRVPNNTTHYCSVTGRTHDSDNSSDFIISAAIGAVTDNALIGGLLGGSIVGAVLGDFLSDGELF